MIAILVGMKWHLVVFGLHFFITNEVELVSFIFERDIVSRGGAEGERESQAGSMLRAEPDAGLDLTTLGS